MESLEEVKSNEELVELIQSGVDTADNMLILWNKNEGLISKIIYPYKNILELDDMRQESYLALIDAVNSYDSSKDVKFSTYYPFWIVNHINNLLETANGISISQSALSLIRKYNKVTAYYETSFNRRPTRTEYRTALNVNEDELKKIELYSHRKNTVSTNTPLSFSNGEDLFLEDSLVDPEDKYEECLNKMENEQLSATLNEMVEELPEREKEAVRDKYYEGATLSSTAERMGVSIERVRQLQRIALKRLGKESNKKKLLSFAREQFLIDNSFIRKSVSSFIRDNTSSTEKVALRLIELEEDKLNELLKTYC